MANILTLDLQETNDTDSASKLVYDELSARKSKAEKKLIRNITIQCLVIVLAVAYDFEFKPRIIDLLSFLRECLQQRYPEGGIL